MKTSEALTMTVDEALNYADEWTIGHTFYAGAQGWRVVCAVLASEVRALRNHSEDKLAMIDSEARTIAIDLCNYILIRDKAQGFEAIDTAINLKKLLGAE